MEKFIVLDNASVSARAQVAQATPEQAGAGMEAWMAWSADLLENHPHPNLPDSSIEVLQLLPVPGS